MEKENKNDIWYLYGKVIESELKNNSLLNVLHLWWKMENKYIDEDWCCKWCWSKCNNIRWYKEYADQKDETDKCFLERVDWYKTCTYNHSIWAECLNSK